MEDHQRDEAQAPTEFAENAATELPPTTALVRELRAAFLVLLPGLCTLVVWEMAAWQWPSVARLVSRPVEIARGIVEVDG